MGFFLSLSLRDDGVLPVVKPFAPFPDIVSNCDRFREREREKERVLFWLLRFRFYDVPLCPFIFSKYLKYLNYFCNQMQIILDFLFFIFK